MRNDDDDYMVEDAIWAQAGLAPQGGYLCLDDLKRRLGSSLHAEDFKLTDSFNRAYRHGCDRSMPRCLVHLLKTPEPAPMVAPADPRKSSADGD